MDFEIKERTKIKVSMYGKTFELTSPTVGQSEGFLEKLGELKDDTTGGIRAQKEFIASLGLPMEFINEMESEHFGRLADFIIARKKN